MAGTSVGNHADIDHGPELPLVAVLVRVDWLALHEAV